MNDSPLISPNKVTYGLGKTISGKFFRPVLIAYLRKQVVGIF